MNGIDNNESERHRKWYSPEELASCTSYLKPWDCSIQSQTKFEVLMAVTMKITQCLLGCDTM
jgi:hypothetical protein